MLFTAWRILSLHPPSSKFDKLLSTDILVSSQSSAVAQCKFSAVAVCKFTFNCFTTSSLSLPPAVQQKVPTGHQMPCSISTFFNHWL